MKDIPATPYFIAKTASSGCKTPLTIIGKFVMLFNHEIPSQVRDGSRDLTFIDLGKWSKLAILRWDGNLNLFRISGNLFPKVGASIVRTIAWNPAFSALLTRLAVIWKWRRKIFKIFHELSNKILKSYLRG